MSPDSNFAPSILVVEDEPDFAALISVILREAGYSVTTVSDGEEALAEVSRKVPDLITLDLQIPRKSGPLFYRQMKSRQEYRSIPVIVITGVRESREADVVLRSFLEAEGKPAPDAYFDKPFDRHELVKIVEHCLARIPLTGTPRAIPRS